MMIDYETIEIPSAPDAVAEFEILESPWITIHDGINGEYYQYNRETGETREVPADWWD